MEVQENLKTQVNNLWLHFLPFNDFNNNVETTKGKEYDNQL